MSASGFDLRTLVAQAISSAPFEVQASSGVSLDSDMMSAAMMLVMILGMVMVWEGLKWLVMEINYEWTPGASRRRLRRLEKL